MTCDEVCDDALAKERSIDTAIELAGTGKFTKKVIIIGALMVLNASFVTTSISLIFPAASCDFNLSTLDQGVITATPLLGMIFGSYFYGCLADLSGRKRALLVTLFSQGLFEALSAVVSNYWGFLFFKFLTGFSLIAQNGVGYPYVGECLPPKLRRQVLCALEIAWIIGMIILPGFAWAIIPLEFTYTTDYFFFHSWNLFVLLYSLLAPALALWLLTFPETPKYLADCGEDAKLAEALGVMHSENTGRPFKEYLEALTKHDLRDLRTRLESPSSRKHELSKSERTGKMCMEIVANTVKLLRPPFLKQTALICALQFCIGSTYFSFALWFAELIRRLENFEATFPGEPSWICSVVPKDVPTNITIETGKCLPEIPTNVYMHTLIISLACLPSNILVPLCIEKLGYKFFIVTYNAGAFFITAGLFFVQSSIQNLILSAFYEAFTSVGLALVLVVITELYPTQIRATASAFGMLLGRIGGVFGNLLIGYLIDKYCGSFIVITMGQLLVCVIIGFILPVKRGEKKTVTEFCESPVYRIDVTHL
ncbi:synaptic vesicle glycoprotein 2C-like [Diachasmimorpha longicaudata]|uniref:synaptic vesicle glycoprotein 2C-like n=1 Tax=Diachasmimorpha longicaudata TaxID=58733 RepID=UPI0030B90FA9